MNDTHTQPLKETSAVLELADIQKTLGLPDADFVRTVKLSYSGSSWGKIKSGTFSGNEAKALREAKRALASYRTGGPVSVRLGDVMFDHIDQAADAVTIARAADDEHKLVIVSGTWGAGKSTTARHIVDQFGGHYFHAKPSWASSYLRALTGIATAIGLGDDFRSVGDAETKVLRALEASPCLLVIDEANHFSKDSLNFLKTILNETKCAIVLFTLPGHLARIAATHSEETRQLLRRAVSIVHIGSVSSADVMAVHSGLYPEIHLGHAAPSIAACANRHYRMDTVRRIFDEADPADADDLPRAVERVERSIKTILQTN
jgi:DNA transposition AAA+ family ATPase